MCIRCCIACLSLLIIETSFAEPLPRVGDTIDVAERNYFQLFPTITEFSEAIVTRNEGGDGIAIRSRNPRQDVKIRLDSAEHAELSHYLNDYEEIGFGKQKVDRARLSDFIWYKPQPQRKGAMIKVGKSSGELTRVKLFHFADSSITVFYPHIVPDWNDPYTFSVFPADEIEFISTCETNQFRAASIGFFGWRRRFHDLRHKGAHERRHNVVHRCTPFRGSFWPQRGVCRISC